MSEFPAKLGIPEWEFRLVFGRTSIEYDPTKEDKNRKKHGYSLIGAVAHLERSLLPTGKPQPFITSDSFEKHGEFRHTHLTIDDSGIVVLIVTTMRSEETVRVISYRRADAKERDEFFKATGYAEP